MSDESWEAIFERYQISDHDFNLKPYYIEAQMIKTACQEFTAVGQKEVRILCKQDSREKRPKVFRDQDLFILPVKNGKYAIVKGEGYVDIPEISRTTKVYQSSLDFDLDTSKTGDSEMQHLDYAYATSLIRTFMGDPSLLLTIRGRKYTPFFRFNVGNQTIEVEGVQTEVDGGYEGRSQVVLVEAKNSQATNTIIRQLYYPFRQWEQSTAKKVITLFFEKRFEDYSIWQFSFRDKNDYNSIQLDKSGRFRIRT